MSKRAFPLMLSAAAAAGIGAAPAAAAAGHGGLVEICTSRGSAWVRLPADRDAPGRPNGQIDQSGCAHVLCPRGRGPERRKSARPA